VYVGYNFRSAKLQHKSRNAEIQNAEMQECRIKVFRKVINLQFKQKIENRTNGKSENGKGICL
jgi:hypothetical protein